MKLTDLMMRDEQRRKLHNNCDFTFACNDCDLCHKDDEIAAIAHAVVVMGEKGLLPTSTDISKEQFITMAKGCRALITEARGVMG